jgi:hypothetical protein
LTTMAPIIIPEAPLRFSGIRGRTSRGAVLSTATNRLPAAQGMASLNLQRKLDEVTPLKPFAYWNLAAYRSSGSIEPFLVLGESDFRARRQAGLLLCLHGKFATRGSRLQAGLAVHVDLRTTPRPVPTPRIRRHIELHLHGSSTPTRSGMYRSPTPIRSDVHNDWLPPHVPG